MQRWRRVNSRRLDEVLNFFCNRAVLSGIRLDVRQSRRAPPNPKHIMKATLILLTLGLTLGSVQARDFGRATGVATKRGSATRAVSGSVVPGAASHSAVTTGAQGKSVATAQQVVRNADGTGRAKTSSVTGPQGQTATTNGSVTCTATRSVTTPSGETKSVTNTTSK